MKRLVTCGTQHSCSELFGCAHLSLTADRQGLSSVFAITGFVPPSLRAARAVRMRSEIMRRSSRQVPRRGAA